MTPSPVGAGDPGASTAPGSAAIPATRSTPVRLGPGAGPELRARERGAGQGILRRLELPVLAVSLGGVDSIAAYPVTMSHAAMPREERERRGVTAALVRLSVGLEAPEDLLADITRALGEAGASDAR